MYVIYRFFLVLLSNPSNVQRLLLLLCSEITPASLGESYRVLSVEPGSAMCNPTVLPMCYCPGHRQNFQPLPLRGDPTPTVFLSPVSAPALALFMASFLPGVSVREKGILGLLCAPPCAL